MIIKKMDSKQEEIAELTALLKGKLTPQQRFLIERELRTIRNGVSGEKDSAKIGAIYQISPSTGILISGTSISFVSTRIDVSNFPRVNLSGIRNTSRR